MNETQKSDLVSSLLGKSTPEAVGDILREGLDFRIVKDDDGEYITDQPGEGIVDLKISKRKVVGALMN